MNLYFSLFQVLESATVDFCGEVVIVPQTKDAKVTFDLEFRWTEVCWQ